MTRTLTAIATAAVIAAGTMTVPTPAAAGGRGAAVAAGIFGGLVAGALVGSALARPYPYGYYYAPAPHYVYGPRCFWTRQRVWDGYGWRRARVRVCH